MGISSLTTLDARGQLTNPMHVLDQALSDAFCSNFSQSVRYKGKVSSMVYLIQRHTDDSDGLIDATRNMLTIYLERFFERPQVIVTIEEPSGSQVTKDSRFVLRLEITFTSKGIAYDAAHLAYIQNSEFQKIINIAKGQ